MTDWEVSDAAMALQCTCAATVLPGSGTASHVLYDNDPSVTHLTVEELGGVHIGQADLGRDLREGLAGTLLGSE